MPNTPAVDIKAAPERLLRPSVPAVDAILGHPFPVLDQGFIRVVDYMGSDEAVVQAARVSYGLGTKKVNEDRGLIRYLLRHRHTTPFEMCEIKLHVRVPMDCWRQWIRHRTANVNEYSTRYSIAIDATQQTEPGLWRTQSGANRQGSGEFVDEATGQALSEREAELHALSRRIYDERLEANVAREQARKDLPLSTYTEAYWKIDLHNLLHFLHLRMDAHAQYEIRAYANAIGSEVVNRWCPTVWEAFQDYIVDGEYLTRLEREIVFQVMSGDEVAAQVTALKAGWLDADGAPQGRNRERAEFEAKARRLGISVPWKLM